MSEVNTASREKLQQHARCSRDEKLRYCHLLWCVNSLFGIDSKMIENLFCLHITGDSDMGSLLGEKLNKERPAAAPGN